MHCQSLHQHKSSRAVLSNAFAFIREDLSILRPRRGKKRFYVHEKSGRKTKANICCYLLVQAVDLDAYPEQNYYNDYHANHAWHQRHQLIRFFVKMGHVRYGSVVCWKDNIYNATFCVIRHNWLSYFLCRQERLLFLLVYRWGKNISKNRRKAEKIGRKQKKMEEKSVSPIFLRFPSNWKHCVCVKNVLGPTFQLLVATLEIAHVTLHSWYHARTERHTFAPTHVKVIRDTKGHTVFQQARLVCTGLMYVIN